MRNSYKPLDYQSAIEYQRRPVQGELRWVVFTPPPTITLGLRAEFTREVFTTRQTLSKQGIEVLETDRGGLATYHGPGQLVVFPVMRGEGLSVRSYIQCLLMTVARTCQEFSNVTIRYQCTGPAAGLWVGQRKIGSLGLRFTREAIFHGVAINIDPRVADGFRWISPCGMGDSSNISSLLKDVPDDQWMQSFVELLLRNLEEDFKKWPNTTPCTNPHALRSPDVFDSCSKSLV